jgi:hypothetical protein
MKKRFSFALLALAAAALAIPAAASTFDSAASAKKPSPEQFAKKHGKGKKSSKA